MGINAYATGDNLTKYGAFIKYLNAAVGVALGILAFVTGAYALLATAVMVAISGFAIAELLDAVAIIVYDVDCLKTWKEQEREKADKKAEDVL